MGDIRILIKVVIIMKIVFLKNLYIISNNVCIVLGIYNYLVIKNM